MLMFAWNLALLARPGFGKQQTPAQLASAAALRGTDVALG